MSNISEIATGLLMMLQSALHAVRTNFLKSDYLLITLLLVVHFLLSRMKQSKRLMLLKWTTTTLIILACISGFIYFQQKTLHAYAVFIPTMEPLDLKCNYYGALESSLYHTTVTDRSKWGMTAVFMPPVFAVMRASTPLLGESFEEYYRNYRICGIIAAALTVMMLIGFTLKKLGKRSLREIVILSFAINTLLFLLPYFVTDIRIGNTNVFVGVLVAAQLLMTVWDRRLSKFLQAFLLVLAWWIKPNMILVIWCLTVFSISRRDYSYFLGLACGAVAPIIASLLAANVSLETYIIYFTQVSKVIEQMSLTHSSNLSIFAFAGNPISAYRIALLLAALFVLVYTFKVKGDDFIRFEIFCFMITYIFWTRVWAYYFIPVALITWVNIVNRIGEKKTVYVELILVLFLSISLAFINVIGVNVALAANAVVYLGWHVFSSRKQMAVSREGT